MSHDVVMDDNNPTQDNIDTDSHASHHDDDPNGWARAISLNSKYPNKILTGPSVEFGRRSTCGMHIRHPAVSGLHCTIFNLGNGVINLQDHSTNGTFVRGLAVGKGRTIALNDGDEVILIKSQTEKVGYKIVFLETKKTLNEAELKYKLGETLGSGAFAIVRRCADRATGQAYAMKIIDKKKFVQIQQTSRPESLMDEVSILRRADHRGIIKLFDLIETPTTLYLVLELVEGGDLFDHIVAQEGKGFTEDVARHMFMQMLQAMKYLHSKNIVHRDLKPENILLVSKDSHDIRISDFGLSRVVGVGSFMKTMCLASGTEVALFNVDPVEDASGHLVAAERFMRVDDLLVDTRLAGTNPREGVKVTNVPVVGTADVMYEVCHSDKSSYTVTEDHLVTLRWIAEPYADIQPRAGRECSDSITFRWWSWRDGKLTQGHFKERRCRITSEGYDETMKKADEMAEQEYEGFRPTDDARLPTLIRASAAELRGALWDEFDSLVESNPSHDAAFALRAGDLFEIPVSQLAKDEFWNVIIAEQRATAYRVALPKPTDEVESVKTTEMVSQAFKSLPVSIVGAGYKADAGKSYPVIPVANGEYREVVAGDAIRLVLMLHNPVAGAAGMTLTARGGGHSRALDNIQRILSDVPIEVGDECGIAITELNTIADSHESEYNDVCAEQIILTLKTLGASTIISCGRFASRHWRNIATLVDSVTAVHNGVDDAGFHFTTFLMPLESPQAAAAEGSADAHTKRIKLSSRKVTVWHVPHPYADTRREQIGEAIAHAIGIDGVTPYGIPSPQLVAINKIEKKDQKYIKFSVDGDNRFALKNGLITHNCGTPQYLAPEILMESQGGAAAPVGLSGLAPFSSRADDPNHLQSLIKSGQFSFPNPQWNRVGQKARDLVRRLLTVDPRKRITIEQAEQHEWMQQGQQQQQLKQTMSTKRKEAPSIDLHGSAEKRRVVPAVAAAATGAGGGGAAVAVTPRDLPPTFDGTTTTRR